MAFGCRYQSSSSGSVLGCVAEMLRERGMFHGCHHDDDDDDDDDGRYLHRCIECLAIWDSYYQLLVIGDLSAPACILYSIVLFCQLLLAILNASLLNVLQLFWWIFTISAQKNNEKSSVSVGDRVVLPKNIIKTNQQTKHDGCGA